MESMAGRTSIKKEAKVKEPISKQSKSESTQIESNETAVDRVLWLQRTVGNPYTTQLLRSGAIQARLAVTQSNDIHEREANRLLDSTNINISGDKHSLIQRKPVGKNAKAKEGDKISIGRKLCSYLLMLSEQKKKEKWKIDDYASWILKMGEKGFVKFNRFKCKEQLEKIRDGEDYKKEDKLIVPVMYQLVRKPIVRYLCDKMEGKKVKPPSITLGSFIREGTGSLHNKGNAIDINDLSFTDAKGVSQVINILGDLPKGTYELGLPYQGEFFQYKDSLKKQRESRKLEIIGIKMWRAHILKQKWDENTMEWGIPTVYKERKAYTYLKSTTLKNTINAMEKKGHIFYVIPDKKGHIHIGLKTGDKKTSTKKKTEGIKKKDIYKKKGGNKKKNIRGGQKFKGSNRETYKKNAKSLYKKSNYIEIVSQSGLNVRLVNEPSSWDNPKEYILIKPGTKGIILKKTKEEMRWKDWTKTIIITGKYEKEIGWVMNLYVKVLKVKNKKAVKEITNRKSERKRSPWEYTLKNKAGYLIKKTY